MAALAPLCAAALCAAAPGPARAFDPAVMESAVSVLPLRPAAARARMAEPEGSGVAVFAGGYIATADHVLDAAGEVDVRLHSGRRLPARIIGRHGPSDIALIKIDADLPVRPVNYAPALGAPVCAVGNPFGAGLSVSCGVVSALRRTGMGFNPFEDFIQTDAAVNPGASGGGLFDAAGAFTGMTAAVFTPPDHDVQTGVNFAASAALVMRVAEDLRRHGAVRRAVSGLVTGPLDAGSGGGSGPGALIRRVNKNSPAERAGLAPGGVITAAGGRAVRKPADVTSAVFLRRPGDTIVFTVRRGAGAAEDVPVTLGP